jgi:ribonuclease HII
MEKAVLSLEKKIGKQATMLLIDGNFGIALTRPHEPIIKGDETVFLISLASIVAKVERDSLMRKMHKKYPQYGFDKHKGYGTKQHLAALSKFGLCKIHRRSFGPNVLQR